MAINPEIRIPSPETTQLLTRVTYNYHNGPETPLEVALMNGANCQWLAHAYHRFVLGNSLPRWALSAEIFTNRQKLFPSVQPEQELVNGDFFFYGRANSLPHQLHITVFTGQTSIEGYPLLAQLGYETNGFAILTPDELQHFTRYSEFRGIRRYSPPIEISTINSF